MAITAGSNNFGSLNSVLAPTPQALSSNYIDFTSTATQGWAQQYMPDLMEKEAEVFGNRTISGFLSQVGAEEAMTSDQVVWSEQGRLHLSYKGHIEGATGGTVSGGQIEIETDIDGNDIGTDHGIRPGDLLLLANNTSGAVCKAIVTTAARGTTGDTHDQIQLAVYGHDDLNSA